MKITKEQLVALIKEQVTKYLVGSAFAKGMPKARSAGEDKWQPSTSAVSEHLNNVQDIRKLLYMVGFTISTKELLAQLKEMPQKNRRKVASNLLQIEKLIEEIQEMLP